MNFEQFLPVIIALVGSAGLWGFLSLKAKQNHERSLKDDAKSAQFNETLKEQVDRLAEKLDVLTVQKEELLREIADMRAELAEARATIKHLEEMLRNK